MASTRTISIYLLKPEIRSARAALKDEIGELREHVVAAGETVGTLFVSEGDQSPPDWVKFLADVTEPRVEDLTRSLSALLLIEASGRWFAIAFGYGRRLLDPDVYERDFGLKCALNGVDPKLLRGAEARTFDDYALHTLRQLSRLSTIGSLELNTDRELVVSLAGQLDDPNLGKRIDGRDAVRITAEIQPDQLHSKCGELLAMSEKTDYQETFPFFDTIRRVSDPGEIARLEGWAFSALGQQKFEEFDLFPPQILSEEIVAFRFKSSAGKPTEVIEPDSHLLAHPIRGPQSSKGVKAKLERFRLRGIDGNGDVVDEWSFLECLHWEHKEGDAVYVLDGGEWYRIKQSLVAEVETFAKELKPSGISWPRATNKQHEDEYNAAAAAALGFALLDRRLVTLPGQTSIEPCDLFTAQRQFVHVKHRKGGSAPLSHLFAQAVVAAQCFTLEPEFRAKFSQKLEAAKPGFGAHSPENAVVGEYEVVLAMITTPSARGNVAEELPFFSKVVLRLAVRQLTAMGFKVSVDAIPTKVVVPTGRTTDLTKKLGLRPIKIPPGPPRQQVAPIKKK